MIKNLANKILGLTLILTAANQAYANELLSGCVMNNGALTHQVFLNDNKFLGRFDFPTFRDFETDPSGSTHKVNVPLSNDSIFAHQLGFLEEKEAVFRTIFGKKTELVVEFDHCELQESHDKTLAARFCSKLSPTEINGVKLKSIHFGIQNQIRTSLVGSHGQTGETHVVYANLRVITESNVAYKSSFTYYPNGNSTQCTLTENIVYKQGAPDQIKLSLQK